MRELLLVGTVALIFVFGYFIIKKFDAFLVNNRRSIETENTKPNYQIQKIYRIKK